MRFLHQAVFSRHDGAKIHKFWIVQMDWEKKHIFAADRTTKQ